MRMPILTFFFRELPSSLTITYHYPMDLHDPHHPPIPGRGTSHNPPNRFESAHLAPDPDPQPAPPDPEADPRTLPLTQYLPDHSQSIIATNTSPDIPFKASINPYRGCSHGCIYCYARPTHEYLGMSAGLDFETKILVKHDAPKLLRQQLTAKSWHPQLIALSGVTDCYQPIERQLRLTRQCLEVLLDFRNPVGIVTKNNLVTRDLDILTQLAAFHCIHVTISITTLDANLTRIMGPRTSVPRDRLRAIRELSAAGVPVGVIVAPVIPALTDHEIPAILEAAREAGAVHAAFTPLRLPYGVKDLFADWLEQHFPDRKNKVLNRIRDLRGGALNDPRLGNRMEGQGAWADCIGQMFALHSGRLGFNVADEELLVEHFRRVPDDGQMALFE